MTNTREGRSGGGCLCDVPGPALQRSAYAGGSAESPRFPARYSFAPAHLVRDPVFRGSAGPPPGARKWRGGIVLALSGDASQIEAVSGELGVCGRGGRE